MYFMGFGPKQISWIKACIVLLNSSELVNGNPIVEFHPERGLRQGDPLSFFLLIIQALNVAMFDAIDLELFKPIKTSVNHIPISHLLYANDAIFIGAWTRKNVKIFFLS